MTEPLFPYGYAGSMLTMAQIEAKRQIRDVNPEFWRRFRTMMIAAYIVGIPMGPGGATRYEAAQLAEAMARHTTTPTGRTSQVWQGVRYWLRNGVAAYLFPGKSAHEQGATPKGSVAIDQVPAGTARSWMNRECSQFWLKHFANVNREPWHVQPAEWANARSQFPKLLTLSRKELPTLDMADIVTTNPLPAPGVEINPPPPKPQEARMIKLTIDIEEMRLGARGRDVGRVQGCINVVASRDLDTDGYYGPMTEAAILDLQTFFGMVIDGVAGPKTLAVLFDL